VTLNDPATAERTLQGRANDTVLSLHDVMFRRNGRLILDDISFEVAPGEHWALLGPNGAGKSTILSMCGASAHPTSGIVEVLGSRLGRVDLQELRRRIGHVNPRHPIRSPMTVEDVVLTGFTGTIDTPLRWEPTVAQIAAARERIAQVGLSERRDAVWPTMSQGERGRALIARALAPEPQLLLLDEPTTGLDVAAREQLLETVDHLSVQMPHIASVLVTHHLEELPESTSHALLIGRGRVVACGPIRETVTTETVSRAFEHPIGVAHHDGRWSARALRTAVAAGGR